MAFISMRECCNNFFVGADGGIHWVKVNEQLSFNSNDPLVYYIIPFIIPFKFLIRDPAVTERSFTGCINKPSFLVSKF